MITAFTGQFFVFLMAAIAAIEHECAHAFTARRMGYTLDKIVLMPYGAVISGDIAGISRREEACVCVAGPLANGITALFFVALWWLYPETYPYTDVAFYVSLSLFFVNLIPAYPLDGGRLLKIVLRPLGEKLSRRILTAVSLAVAAGIAGYFIYTCFSAPQWTALAFSVLLAAGCFGGGSYNHISFSREKSFARGIEELRIAISADCTAGYALRFLREDKYVVFDLFEKEEFYGELSEEELLDGAQGKDYSTPLREYLPQI
ncbi:MAG: site-2 protease family protein [Clostridiales bacterium]|nr:site-2 protease family protein [Clostridiales bacterium]